MALFTPQIETQGAQQQVANPVTAGGAGAALQAFAPVTENLVKTGIGFYQKGKLDDELADVSEELKGLDNQFTNIKDALASGKARRGLETRARAALNSAKAASPMLADYADQLYSAHFGSAGSGGGTSSFQPTAAEEAASKMEGQIATYMMQGFSEQQAMGIIQSGTQADYAKNQAETLANTAKINMYQVGPVVNTLFNDADVQFNVKLQTMLQQNGGTLGQENMINFNRDIDAWGVTMRQQLQRTLVDPKTGSYKIAPAEAEKMLEKVNTYVANQKAILKDNGYQKFLTDRKDTLSNEAQVVAIESFPELATVRAAGGDQAASTWLEAKLDGNEKLASWVASTDPMMQAFLTGDPKAVKTVSVKSAAKLFGGTDLDAQTNISLSPMEAAVAGDMIASNHLLAVNILEKAGNLAQVTKTYPQALAATYNPKVNRVIKNKPSSKERIQDMQNGAMTNFSSMFRDEFGRFPSGVQIQIDKRDPKSILSSGRPYANMASAIGEEKISIASTSGDKLTQQMTNVVADLYRSVKANPEAVPDALKDFTPEQVVSIWVNSGMALENLTEPVVGVIAEDLGFSYQTQDTRPKARESATDTSSGTQVIRTTESVDDYQTVGKGEGFEAPTLPTTDKELKAFKEFKAKGLTPEQITAIYGSMQYNEPSINDVQETQGGLVDAPITDRAQIARKYAAYLRGE